jgi:hypothetical protein
MKFFKQSLAVLLTALSLNGTAEAAFVNVGEANSTNNTATGIVDGNQITTDTRWTRDNVYILRRVIFVTNGATLTIEPGTIIRGVTAVMSGFTTEPGALVAARGGKIIANGTADDPIIFTSIDDTNVPGGFNTVPETFTSTAGTPTTIRTGTTPSLTNGDYDPDGPEGDSGFSKAARWGGVVICGNAYVAANTSTGPDANVDGIADDHATIFSDGSPTQNANVGADYPEGMSTDLAVTVYNSSNALYGGLNDNDSSGVLRFVSIRYGGFVLGDPAVGNEINSLTMCGMGQGTVLEHVESYQNLDDAFEWFGGKCNSRFLYSLSCQDDGFDGDEGHRGTGQFWLLAQGTINETPAASLRSGFTFNDPIGQNNTGSDYRYDKLMEWDGPEPDNGDRLPMTDVNVYNATFLSGDTKKQGFTIVKEAHVTVRNAIVERSSAVSAAAQAATIGTITSLLTWDNIHSFTTAATGAAEVGTVTSSGINVLTQITPLVEEATSQIATPWFPAGFTAAPIYTKNGFDPRLAPGANARTEDGPTPPAGLVNVTYAGAMLDNNMLAGWSVLESLQVLPTTNLARPVLTIGASGANPTVSWTSAGAAIKYVVEKSTDGKVWAPVQAAPVTGTGTVVFTDTTTTIGAPVLYRVYGL